MKKIGFPRALYYYLYYPFWEEFFSALDFEVIVSEPTSKRILDDGVKVCVNDACLPIKLFHGHVLDLSAKVDVLFLPRMVSVRTLGTETFCPKFLGLPDIIKSSINDLPMIIDERIDLAKGKNELKNACLRIGERLSRNKKNILKAFKNAQLKEKEFQLRLQNGQMGEDAIKNQAGIFEANAENNKKTRIAFLGYPYLVYDSFVNVNALEILRSLGVEIKTVEMLSEKTLLNEKKEIGKDLFWHFSNRVIHATLHYLKTGQIDGLIHVTAFGCGPDSMVDMLMEIEAEKYGVPFLTLSVDEHTGNAGIATRIEAFFDMISIRGNKK